MKILIVDNNDSFTYNLKHYIQTFTKNVDVIRGSELILDEIQSFDKIILSPGPGIPDEHCILNKLLKEFHQSKSILGICLGHQSIAEYFGAQLVNLIDVKHGVATTLTHFSNCILFNNVPNSFKVGHYHSWVVSESSFPDSLEITSKNSDGIIMSIQHKEFDIKGVQFHPESVLTEYGMKIIENWLLS